MMGTSASCWVTPRITCIRLADHPPSIRCKRLRLSALIGAPSFGAAGNVNRIGQILKISAPGKRLTGRRGNVDSWVIRSERQFLQCQALQSPIEFAAILADQKI